MKSHFVYVIAAIEGGVPVAPCKIGVSHQPNARLSALQTGSAKKLEVIGAVPLPTRPWADGLEKALHEQFAEQRLAGEWFDVSPVDVVLGGCALMASALDEAGFSQAEIDATLSSLGIADVAHHTNRFIDACLALQLPLQSRIADGRRAGRANGEGV